MTEKVHLTIRPSYDMDALDEVWALKDEVIIWEGRSEDLKAHMNFLVEEGMDTLVIHPDIYSHWGEKGLPIFG